MREFSDKIFFGHGEYSASLLRKLKAKVEYAAILLSEAQWYPTTNDIGKNEQEIEDIVKDIAMALTGKDIQFKG